MRIFIRCTTSYFYSAIIFQGILGTLASVRMNSRCPEEEYNTCLAPVIDKVTISNSAFPYFNDQQLDSLCGACDGLTQCIETVDMRHCDHLELLYIDGFKKTCKYFCVEGPDYRKHRNCFNNSELQSEGSKCNYTFFRQQAQQASLVIEDGGIKGQATTEERELWCGYVSQFISCMKNAVVQHCSEKAGEWVLNINLQYYHPFMEKMECETGSKVGVAVIFGVAVGLFVTMIVVIVTSVVCRRKQHNNFNNLSATKKGNKTQTDKDAPIDMNGKQVLEGSSNNVIKLKQYYPEGESLLSSETSHCPISTNEASTRHTDVSNICDDVTNSVEREEDPKEQQQEKRLLISDV